MKIDTNTTIIQPNLKQRDQIGKAGEMSGADNERDIQLRQKSKDLEAVFITQMFKEMEKTIPKSTLSGSKNTLSSMMFSSVMGEALSNQGGIGLSDIIYRSLREKNEIPELDEIRSNPVAENVHSFMFTNLEETR
ncbi:MAG: hypothetical protein HN590_11460 [Calditrichaeota bacterium]|jgi:Rod binding domain-containing protein|nr:hypothetical protein [Calditrichota bacterium]MBT7789220.1 hypothetical protein [Calditrichota bacterium]